MPLGSATRMTLCIAAIFLPLTLQDQGFHKKMKKGMARIAEAVTECWENQTRSLTGTPF